MRKSIYRGLIGFGSILFLMNCGSQAPVIEEPIEPIDRVIHFSGFEWIVRDNDAKQGPGPNYFSNSEDNVWIDNSGKLHLKITQKGGNWYCAGIYAKQPLGNGKYTFYINSDITKLDQNVVAGLFTYLNDTEEIDIEFSKWSIPNNANAQFAIQPADAPGNKFRFDIPADSGPTKHEFNWQADQVNFSSGFNSSTNGEMFANWKYEGAQIPKPSNEKMRLNLWLFKGQMPSNLKEQEIIIDSVSFKR